MSAGKNTRILPGDPRLINETKCRLHPDAVVEDDHSTGNSVCTECGLVLAFRMIDESADWRNYENGPDHARCGPPESFLRDTDEPTTYLCPPKRRLKYPRGYGPPEVVAAAYRKLQSSSSDKDSRLRSAYNQIRGVACRMHIPHSISDYAMILYKKLREVSNTDGNYLESVSAAILYIACGHKGCPRPMKEFVNNVGSTYKEVSASYRRIAPRFDTEAQAPRLGTAASYVPRYCALLRLPISVRKLAQKIALGVMEHCLMDGRSPVSVATGSICVAAEVLGHPRTAKQIAKVASNSRRTVRECYMQINARRDLLIGNGPQERVSEMKPEEGTKEVNIGVHTDDGKMISGDAGGPATQRSEANFDPEVGSSNLYEKPNAWEGADNGDEETILQHLNKQGNIGDGNLKLEEYKHELENLFGEIRDISDDDGDSADAELPSCLGQHAK